jgi:hypothetical protein
VIAETELVKPEFYEGVLSLKLRVVEAGIDRVYMTCQDLRMLSAAFISTARIKPLTRGVEITQYGTRSSKQAMSQWL